MNKTEQPRQGNHTDEFLTPYFSLYSVTLQTSPLSRSLLTFFIPRLSLSPGPSRSTWVFWSLKAPKSFLLCGNTSDQGLRSAEKTAKGGTNGTKMDSEVDSPGLLNYRFNTPLQNVHINFRALFFIVCWVQVSRRFIVDNVIRLFVQLFAIGCIGNGVSGRVYDIKNCICGYWGTMEVILLESFGLGTTCKLRTIWRLEDWFEVHSWFWKGNESIGIYCRVRIDSMFGYSLLKCKVKSDLNIILYLIAMNKSQPSLTFVLERDI